MGPPAARIGDMHLCPMVTPGTPPIPHVGGPIIKGQPTVLTGGMPQARIGDTCVCVGPPDVIAMGAVTVLVGSSPAARIGDSTVHGGAIILGWFTVLIGGASGGASGGAGGVGPMGVPGAGGPGTAGGTTHKATQGGSTTVTVDPATGTITIRTKMEFLGPDATQAYADAAKKQIEETWSGTMVKDGKTYQVKVEVETKVSPNGTGTPGYDPINVNASQARMNQTLYGAGPGNQTPAAATDTGRPRRIAHEYGHTLGLDDGYEDTPTGSQPKDPTKKNDIMSETWPDSNGVLPHPHQDHYDQILKNYGF